MDLNGREIKCPLCNQHQTDIHINKSGNPFIICAIFKGIMNYNSIKGKQFIESLIRGSPQPNPKENNDEIFDGFGESDTNDKDDKDWDW